MWLPQRSPSRDWLLATQPRPGGQAGHTQITSIRAAFDVYQEADAMRGGGHARRA